MKNIAIVILAAGKSSRMNSIKQLEKINNKTLLEITLDKIKSLASENIFCVLGSNSEKIKSEINTENIQFIENSNFEEGLSSSIVAAIKHFEHKKINFDGIFILLADQPLIEVTYFDKMLNLFQENNSTIIASNYGKKTGVPAIFPKKYFSDLLLLKGDKGAKDFINKKKSEIIYPKTTTNFLDIDTQEDLLCYKNSILNS
jgi:molybdenum cofactor cytidylyltransferase